MSVRWSTITPPDDAAVQAVGPHTFDLVCWMHEVGVDSLSTETDVSLFLGRVRLNLAAGSEPLAFQTPAGTLEILARCARAVWPFGLRTNCKRLDVFEYELRLRDLLESYAPAVPA